MTRTLVSALALWAAALVPAAAQTALSGTESPAAGAALSAGTSPVVVELFTSQGCSSCPAADAIMAELAEREDILALSLHVDYWDYIGWADNFADPAYTMRQKAYAHAAGDPRIYTPQMIVGGTDHVIGARPMELAELIRAHSGKDSPVDLTLTRDGETLHIAARADRPLPQGALVQLVRYRPKATVSIDRGENAGHTLVYTNIVESWKPLAEWDGVTDLSLDTDVPGGHPAVVIVQEPGPGPILAAARLR